MKKPLIILASLLCAAAGAQASTWRDSAAISQLFRDAGLNGTFIVYDVRADTFTAHDLKRASARYLPASTFKIPNSLIGLTVGAVDSVDQVLPYGGKPQRVKQWERDMSLRDAIKVSNVPVYQELARRIGLARMREQLARIGYGNNDIGSVVDRFWLDGPLKVSALEQSLFLARLAQDKLPLPKPAMAAVRDITLLEQGADYELHAKTGRTGDPKADLGWWVGWVRKGDRIYAFALNADLVDESDSAKRIPLARASLKALGIL
ncbi:MAG: class D beta-lactamase [Pseudomonadota bacterium]